MLGHAVRTEHDGNSALRAASEFRPDVVLLDIGLPGLNGYEVASRIREQPSLDHTVLVAITANQELFQSMQLDASSKKRQPRF
ncbi:hypothetical protein AXG89_29770 (plasmid) [Burkholderia sp. PAMC 26561]|nr:hypothetical protein AXG89_22910 [Burkholderia sp. PAMC 26561]AME28006.1 hypothetical protein AXG89_29770 [Burkholderia sp. PAMC 26561]